MTQLRIIESLAQIPAADWDALHDGRNPFISHAFLHGLEIHGCLREQWGWMPRHAALFDGDTLVAAAPAYLKHNSHGEFVFDHAWAHAYERFGMDYYPKWLVAAPYSPVTGPRLLARNTQDRRALLNAMREETLHAGLSSLHVNFVPENELDAFDEPWLARGDVQFHWRNTAGWRDFDGFLAALSSKKRKNLRAEREQVRRAGVAFRVVHGDEASAEDLTHMHAFYCATQMEKGNHPALTLPFLEHLAHAMPRQLVIVLAELAGETIAGALFMRGRCQDQKHTEVRTPQAQGARAQSGAAFPPATTGATDIGGDTLYGRYWGATTTLPGLHFETCYYQGIEYCLREGLTAFEPGAQGEHKIARGFLPVLTHSRHFIADPSFAEALRPWCAEDRAAALRYRDQVMQHSPYRETATDPAARP